MISVLADTGPLYALAVRSDHYHEQAREQMIRLRQLSLRLVIAYPIICETQSLLLRRVPVHEVHSWQTVIQRNAGFVNPAPKDYRAAMTLIERYDDQTLSLFDAVLAILSKRLSLSIWTFDSDFDVMGAQVWR